MHTNDYLRQKQFLRKFAFENVIYHAVQSNYTEIRYICVDLNSNAVKDMKKQIYSLSHTFKQRLFDRTRMLLSRILPLTYVEISFFTLCRRVLYIW